MARGRGRSYDGLRIRSTKKPRRNARRGPQSRVTDPTRQSRPALAGAHYHTAPSATQRDREHPHNPKRLHRSVDPVVAGSSPVALVGFRT